MSDRAFDVAVVIGRFQPFHKGHMGVLEGALEKADKVLLLVGSSNRARDTRNPFLFEERDEIIGGVIQDSGVDGSRIHVQPLDDHGYDNSAWMAQVQQYVKLTTKALRPRVCIVGNVRDDTSEYLTWFRDWAYCPVQDTKTNATAIRNVLFDGGVNFESKGWSDQGIDWTDTLYPSTIDFLQRFRGRPPYGYLMKQRAAEKAYKAKWGEGPFITVDPVIIAGGYSLMIERGGIEGEGSVGLPGGFLKKGLSAIDGAVEEAIEETALFIRKHEMPEFLAWIEENKRRFAAGEPKAPDPLCVQTAKKTLRSYFRGRTENFDDPNRSRRGHLVTIASLFVLPDGHGLPPVKGCDDARDALWLPISDLSPLNTFEDHAFIVDRMISLHL